MYLNRKQLHTHPPFAEMVKYDVREAESALHNQVEISVMDPKTPSVTSYHCHQQTRSCVPEED